MAHPNAPTEGGVVASISGFRPMLTGTTCDLCNAGLVEGDDVLVTLDHYPDGWRPTGTYCAEHEMGLRESRICPNAVVACDLGGVLEGRAAPLYNPTVRAFDAGAAEEGSA